MTIVLGGGYIGQLLKFAMPTVRVFDWRPEAPKVQPRDFGPQYLWRALPGLDHESFNVRTTVNGRPATRRSIEAYKAKVGKTLDAADWRTQFKSFMPGYRAVLPPMEIEYGKRVEKIRIFERVLVMADGSEQRYDRLLSAIPLPALLQLTGLDTMFKLTLTSKPIYVTIEPPSDSIRSMRRGWMWVDYDGEETSPVYRRTHMPEGLVHAESLIPTSGARKLTPGKIFANPDVPKTIEALNDYGIHTFGRFASWAPEELAHETYEQILQFSEGVLR